MHRTTSPPILERLEDRTLLSATSIALGVAPGPGDDIIISGRKFEDLNVDHSDNNGTDPGIGGITILVYKDVDNDGQLNPAPGNDGNPVATTVTAADGTYTVILPGNMQYLVAEQTPEGSVQTFGPPWYVVNQSADRLDFGNAFEGSIHGFKFEDLDVDGVWDQGEPPLEGVQIHLNCWFNDVGMGTDATNQGISTNEIPSQLEQWTTTDENGEYWFKWIPPGVDCTVSEIPPIGSIPTTSPTVGPLFIGSGVEHVATQQQGAEAQRAVSFPWWVTIDMIPAGQTQPIDPPVMVQGMATFGFSDLIGPNGQTFPLVNPQDGRPFEIEEGATRTVETEILSMDLTGFHPQLGNIRVVGEGGGRGTVRNEGGSLVGGFGGNFQVDSFFDIDYRIELTGAPGQTEPMVIAPEGPISVGMDFTRDDQIPPKDIRWMPTIIWREGLAQDLLDNAGQLWDTVIRIHATPHVELEKPVRPRVDSRLAFGNAFEGSIHGFKFHDLNVNGVWDRPNEPGLAHVPINLLAAPPNPGVAQVVATTFTDENGEYWFEWLEPGLIYTVQEDLGVGMQTTRPSAAIFLGSGEEHVALAGQALTRPTQGPLPGNPGSNLPPMGPIEMDTLRPHVPGDGYLEFINPTEHPNLVGLTFPTTPPGVIQTEEYTGYTLADGTDIIEVGDSHTTAGDRADFDWVQENRFCETGGECNVGRPVNHPGLVGAMGWTIGTTERSPHVDPGNNERHNHSVQESIVNGLPALQNEDYRARFFGAVDVFSIISIGQDDAATRRDAALDYEVAFLNTVTGASTTGIIQKVWIPGWTAATTIDDYVARWVPSIPGPYNVIAIEPTSLDDNRTEIDAVKAIPFKPIREIIQADLALGNAFEGSIHGIKFEDLNADGVWQQNVETRRLEGVTIELYDDNGNLLETTQTDANGEYWFTWLTPGETYQVREIPPQGSVQTTPDPAAITILSRQEYVAVVGQSMMPLATPAGTANGLGNNVFEKPPIREVTQRDLAFGNAFEGSIHGFKFEDLDVDGVWDQGEPTLAGVEIVLHNELGQEVGRTFTDANGEWWFSWLRPGIGYRVSEVVPTGAIQTTTSPIVINRLGSGQEYVFNQDQANAVQRKVTFEWWWTLDIAPFFDPTDMPGFPGQSQGKFVGFPVMVQGMAMIEFFPGSGPLLINPADGLPEPIQLGQTRSIDIEIVSLSLSSVDPIPFPGSQGLFDVRLEGNGGGNIQVHNMGGALQGNSTFDVFFEVEIQDVNTGQTMRLVPQGPVSINQTLTPGQNDVPDPVPPRDWRWVPTWFWQEFGPFEVVLVDQFQQPWDHVFTIHASPHVELEKPVRPTIDPRMAIGNAYEGSIHGFKFEDLDVDGRWDEGEPPLEGVTIVLINAQTNQEVARTQTDANGNFWFEWVTPGQRYQVIEIPPQGAIQTTPNPRVVFVGSGEEHVFFEGSVIPPQGQVIEMVTLRPDVPHDGYLEFINPDEHPNFYPSPLPLFALGTEEFTGYTLPDGRDILERGDSHRTAGDWADFDWVQENRPSETGAGLPGNHPNLNPGGLGWTVGSPERSPHIDPGLNQPHNHSVEEGFPNGLPFHENEIYRERFFGAVDVFSIISVGQDTAPVDPVTGTVLPRDAALDYFVDFHNTFTGVSSPGILVKVWIPGWTNATTIDDYVARWVPATPGPYNVITIDPPFDERFDQVTEIDAVKAIPFKPIREVPAPDMIFGNAFEGSIHGYKFEDKNGDGEWDRATEPPLAGVTIILTDENGNNWTTQTDQNGEYWFQWLTPGVLYKVQEEPPVGSRQTTENPAEIYIGSGQEYVADDLQAARVQQSVSFPWWWEVVIDPVPMQPGAPDPPPQTLMLEGMAMIGFSPDLNSGQTFIDPESGLPLAFPNHDAIFDTEIIAMDLRSVDPNVHVSLNGTGRGQLVVSNIGSSGEDGVRFADAFFDVFFDIEIVDPATGRTTTIAPAEPVRVGMQFGPENPDPVPSPIPLRDWRWIPTWFWVTGLGQDLLDDAGQLWDKLISIHAFPHVENEKPIRPVVWDGLAFGNTFGLTDIRVEADRMMLNEGESVKLTISFNNPNPAAGHNVNIMWGDGTMQDVMLPAGQSSVMVTHQYKDDDPSGTPQDPYDIKVTVTDKTTGNSIVDTSKQVIVKNLPPFFTMLTLTPNMVQSGGQATLSGKYADPGMLDTHTLRVDLDGNGTYDSSVPVSGGMFSFVLTFNQPAGTHPVNVQILDDDTGATSAPVNITIKNEIRDVHLFYNNSKYDGNGMPVTVADFAAIDPSKDPLTLGAMASNANVSGYHQGLNGFFVDGDFPSDGANITAASIMTMLGNDNFPDTWANGPAPKAVGVFPNQGVGGSDRLYITFDDKAIICTWLKLTIKADAATGLASDQHFIWGSAPGDTGANPTAGIFNADSADLFSIAVNRTPLGGMMEPVDEPNDLNKDGFVSATDWTVVAMNLDPDKVLNKITPQMGAPAKGIVSASAAPSRLAPLSSSEVSDLAFGVASDDSVDLSGQMSESTRPPVKWIAGGNGLENDLLQPRQLQKREIVWEDLANESSDAQSFAEDSLVDLLVQDRLATAL